MYIQKIVSRIIIICLVLGFGYQQALSQEQEIVRAKYSTPRGVDISWEVTIPDPAPAAVIVLQYIPAGTEIVRSTPAYQSYDIQSGTVKWLLTKVAPGTVSMKMILASPIRKKGDLHGKIIFQNNVLQSADTMFAAPARLKMKKAAIEGC